MAAERVTSTGWENTVAELRGASNLTETVRSIPHKAARLLDLLRKRGACVLTSTPPWTQEQIDAAARRGAHKSADEYTEFVCQELLDFCLQGYWVVLPLSLVRTWKGLRLSPLGVVPQRNRRPRLIVDYTFSGLNQETVRLAPPEAMQFGRALQRVLTNIVHADPRFGPCKLAKIDIADGFYRLWIRIADVLKLGVVLPTTGNTTLVAFPLALPMGWVESPPYFTTMTETACDLANAALARGDPGNPHRLEGDAATLPDTPAPPPWSSTWASDQVAFQSDKGARPPLASADVYVDDFLLVAQTKRQQQRLLRLTLAAIDQVLRPLSASDPLHRKEPTSVKKLRQGDAHWSTQKTILGWDLDTVQGTLQLPPHRVARLRELLSTVQPPRKRMSLREWHRLLGELRSMSPGLPGSRGLFSILQQALSRGDRHRVRLNTHVFACIDDFTWLTSSLGQRPTRLRELVPVAPSDVGACDACRHGMGGVWFDAVAPTAPPIVWRQAFAPAVQRALITAEQPHGSFSISDLELAATIAHTDILAQHRAVHERTIWLASDNKSAVSWATKGSATSASARAYLLRLNALHQRSHRYVARTHHIPGTVNAMADDASRLWHLTDSALLTHFDLHYPQHTSWTLQTLTPMMDSALTGALFKKRRVPESLSNAVLPRIPLSASGRPFVPSSASHPAYPIVPGTTSLFCSSLPTDTAPGRLPQPSPRAISHGGGRLTKCGAGVCRVGGPGPSSESVRRTRFSPHRSPRRLEEGRCSPGAHQTSPVATGSCRNYPRPQGRHSTRAVRRRVPRRRFLLLVAPGRVHWSSPAPVR